MIRAMLAKVIDWIDKFREVGDLAIQYDPGHAALPWAAVRFLLQVVSASFRARPSSPNSPDYCE